MAQVPETIQNPGKPIEVQEFARAVARVINGDLSFGDPTDRVGGGSNGSKDNLSGGWASSDLTDTDFFVNGVSAGSGIIFTHNLNAPTPGTNFPTADSPNVVWPIVCWKTDTDHGPLQLVFRQGDLLSANFIVLRPVAGDLAPDNATVVVWFQVVSPW